VTIGLDGRRLLKCVEAAGARPQLASLPSVLLLRRVWKEQFIDDGGGAPRFRKVKEIFSPSGLITSPYDPEHNTALIDWEAEVVTCAAGGRSISLLPNTYPSNGAEA
jgi:hypothetical protein